MLQAALLGAVAVVLLVVGLSSAFAQDDSTTTSSSTTAPTTTQPPSTTSSTPTTRAPTTTATSRRSTTTTARSTSTSQATTTTTTGTTSTDAVASTTTLQRFLVPDDTLPSRTTPTGSSGSRGLSTDTKLALVVAGLLVVAAIIGVLTWLYWRHTRPAPYLDALDVLSEVKDQGAAASLAAATGTTTPVPIVSARVGAEPGGVSALAGQPAVTSAVRILGPVEPAGGRAAGEADAAGSSPTSSELSAPAAGGSAEHPEGAVTEGTEGTEGGERAGGGAVDESAPEIAVDVREAPTLVTLEDLFGPQQDTSTPVELGDVTDLWSDRSRPDPEVPPGVSGDR